MKRVLIVYEEVPESTKLYAVEMTESELERFSKLAGEFVNLADFPENLQQVADELSARLTAEWEQTLIDPKMVLKSPSFDVILVTGFIL